MTGPKRAVCVCGGSFLSDFTNLELRMAGFKSTVNLLHLNYPSSVLLLLDHLSYFVCMSVLPTRMSVHLMCAWRPQRLEEGVGCLDGAGVMNDLSWVVLGTQPWSSARAQVVLAAELYFQPLFLCACEI